MLLLVINCGSTSIKLDVVDIATPGAESIYHQSVQDIAADPAESLRAIEAKLTQNIELVAHRIVHGGDLKDTCYIDDAVISNIEQCSSFAPLHNPLALNWLKAAESLFPVKHIAVFDTQFFADIPQVARIYSLPQDLLNEHHIYRYGFHGLAHRSMWEQWCEKYTHLSQGGRVITIQLGGGCSICCIEDGKVMDMSMGFSPLEGLMMGTRPGDMDSGVLLHLLKTGYSLDELENMLNKEAGLQGVSGSSAHIPDLLKSDEPDARLAIDLYCYRVRKYIGAYMAVLNGCDGIIFSGGVGEHEPLVRSRVLNNMEELGIHIDSQKNSGTCGSGGNISSDRSRVLIEVVCANELEVIVQEAQTL